MTSREFVDVRSPSVETAIEAGLEELGLASEDEAEIEVLQEPTRGFLGIGGEDAVVRIRRRQKQEASGGRRRGSSDRRARGSSRANGGGGNSSGSRSNAGKSGGGGRSNRSKDGGGGSDRSTSDSKTAKKERSSRPDRTRTDDRDVIPVEDQAEEIKAFLTGLLESFGLEGEVSTRIEDDVIYADVAGEQTEALVGTKGAILQSVLELCRTIVQRKTQQGARIRLDIAGYTERRREALGIYARRLADKVLDEGGEIMLEPMNSADRKVVHDTVSEIDGVRSYSEGEEPHRSVIVAKDE
ncbi:MAG TPA: RNA-binding cell elongation regulator Jag/EloR [Acidimicrobiia bacterium]|nr:RNA-binding cell elongation regulator Jag/EloR [Acidimicrobiia bacterium]